ncbi:hypothetical protein ARMGADRAFT_1015645 [Armillaria gallica]|uniref:AAA-ATPase-like domain-containing protein n=1 Tax=Armillaria gallica TaxID=47427 RepID=A0A2H3DIN7_ARMGA|nr:hypothetical protein ARMGADRAFT_1015645 [Armillaria gallica]
MSVPRFYLALADHNGHQVYLSSAPYLFLAPDATISDLRKCVQLEHDVSCYQCNSDRLTDAWKCTLSFPFGPKLDPVPPGAVKLNDDDPVALHFPFHKDKKPRLIELVFDIEKPDLATLFPRRAAPPEAPPKIKHEHTRTDLGNGVHSTSGSSNFHLPPDKCADFCQLISTQERLYVDKTCPIFAVEQPGFFGVVRRPPGCGKSTWLSTLAYLHDIHYAGDSRLAPFADDVPFPGANKHHIFRLDLADLVPFARSEGDYIPEDLNSPAYSRTYMYAARALKDFVCEELRRFFDKYQEEIDISDQTKSDCFSHSSAKFCLEAALEKILYSSHPLYLLVDNYTAPFLHEHLDEDTKSQIEACLYKEFFCIVGPLVNHGRLDRVFIVGESVSRESKFNYGLGRLGQECTTAAAMQEAFGFTVSQVMSMSEALGIEKGEVIEVLKREGIKAETFMRKGKLECYGPGFYKPALLEFDEDDPPAAVYPMKPVLDVLRRLSRNKT